MFGSKPETQSNPCPDRALVLSGGGARAAYQVGVLKALADILPDADDPNARPPFSIICGTSAGAINAASLAAHSGSFKQSVLDLESVWTELSIDQVYASRTRDLLKGLGKIGLSLLHEGISRDNPLALLDSRPLEQLLSRAIQYRNIQKSIKAGRLKALSVTAMGYKTGESVSFFQGSEELKEWRRYRRKGQMARISRKHLMASSAIPAIFPTIKLGDEYYGDGALRQVAPISPAIHLGADQVFVVGVSSNRNPEHWGAQRTPAKHSPSMGQIAGHMLNSAFIDGLEGDIEHLERVNALVAKLPGKQLEVEGQILKSVGSFVVSPSLALDDIAGRKIADLPRGMRFCLRATGATAKGGGATAASYLLFAQSFIQKLIKLGYQDTMWEREAVLKFFTPPQ